MDCNEIKMLLPEYLANELDTKRLGNVREHLASCPLCTEEAQQMGAVWSALDNLPDEDPPANGRRRFDAMLDAFEQGLGSAPEQTGLFESIKGALVNIWPSRPVFQMATALFFLALGVLSGRMIDTGKTTTNDMTGLRAEVSEIRQLLTVSLMNQASALDRLQGVVMSREIPASDNGIPAALIRRLNNDPNVSVRIAAAEALGQYQGHTWVREKLVSSLSRQTSPLVQVSLIELLTHFGEKDAAGVFEAIIDNKETMEPVRKTARIGLANLL